MSVGLSTSREGTAGSVDSATHVGGGWGWWSPPPIRTEAELGSAECEVKVAGLCRAQAPPKQPQSVADTNNPPDTTHSCVPTDGFSPSGTLTGDSTQRLVTSHLAGESVCRRIPSSGERRVIGLARGGPVYSGCLPLELRRWLRPILFEPRCTGSRSVFADTHLPPLPISRSLHGLVTRGLSRRVSV